MKNKGKEKKLEKLIENFFNENELSFMQYFERYRKKKLLNRVDYHELEEQCKSIASKFPRTLDFLENKIVGELTEDEQNAILEMIDLKEQIKIIEFKEAYKLGFREAYNFFKEMEMLNYL